MVVNFRRWPSKTLFRGRTVLSWIRRWRSGQGGSLVTFCHHWSGKWMGNGWPWIYLRDSFSMDLWLPKWCYRWIPRTSWETRITTRYYEFYEFCPSTVSWFDDEAGCFFWPWAEVIHVPFQVGDFDRKPGISLTPLVVCGTPHPFSCNHFLRELIWPSLSFHLDFW